MKRRTFIKTAGIAAGTTVIDRVTRTLDAAGGGGTPAAASRPNILVIMVDELSADAMSCRLGTGHLRTPNMDRLAARAVSFTRAYSANPLCVPCRTSLLTGRYPHQTKVQSNADIREPHARRLGCMGAIFKGGGYDTGYVGKWHAAVPDKEPAIHGFDVMRSIKNNGIDRDVPAGAVEFLRTKRDTPFLLFTSFVNPHNICEWARGDALPDGPIGDPPEAEACPPRVPNFRPMEDEPAIMSLMRRSYQANPLFPVGGFDERKWRQYRWAYYRIIERVDALIGQVLDSLQASGHRDDTWVIFLSDHGDAQGAHGWNQKTIFDDNVSRVPFFICPPGSSPAATCSHLLNIGIDLIPTLCDIAGIAVPAGLPGLSMKGASEQQRDRRDYIVVQNKMVQGAPIDGVRPETNGRMVRSRRYNYCVYDVGERSESLVDLDADPGETKNLAGSKEHAAVLEQHRRYLRTWRAANGDPFVAAPGTFGPAGG